MKPEIFNRILSATSVTTVVLFAVPFLIGLIGYIVPLQIGARGVALPRLNQLGYWLYAAGAFMFYASFLYAVPETALSPLPPLSDDVFSPSHGVDAWVGGVGLAALGFVCFAISMVATLANMRAPGMAWRRAPIFTWAAATISGILLVVGPVMLAALVMLTVDRHFDGVFFEAGEGGEPLLFSHLSWIFFTGCHTILVIGAVAVISEIVPTSRAQASVQPSRGGRLDRRDRRPRRPRLDAEHVRRADPGRLRVHGDGRSRRPAGPDRAPLLQLDRDDVVGRDLAAGAAGAGAGIRGPPRLRPRRAARARR